MDEEVREPTRLETARAWARAVADVAKAQDAVEAAQRDREQARAARDRLERELGGFVGQEKPVAVFEVSPGRVVSVRYLAPSLPATVELLEVERER